MTPSPHARRRAGSRIGSLALKLLELGLLYCELGLLYLLASLPRYLPRILWRAALLGALLCFVFEFVLRVPDFPFSSAIRLPIGCAALLGLRRLLAVSVEPRSR